LNFDTSKDSCNFQIFIFHYTGMTGAVTGSFFFVGGLFNDNNSQQD